MTRHRIMSQLSGTSRLFISMVGIKRGRLVPIVSIKGCCFKL